MADQNSARPSGERAPWTRSGQSLKRLQRAGINLSHLRLGTVLPLVAVAHISLAILSAGDTTNTIWPMLVIGYGLLFATFVAIPHDPNVTSQHSSFSDRCNWTATGGDAKATERPAASDLQSRSPSKIVSPHPTHQAERTLPRPISKPPTPPASLFTACPDWSDLMAQVSHELRTPLNAMIGFSDAMHAELLGPLDNPRYREYLAHICESGRELLKSTEDTLAMTSLLARQQKFEKATSAEDLNQIIQDAWTFVSSTAADKSITFRLENHSDIAVSADTRALKQTFVNLFSEAARVAAQSCTVVVRTRRFADVVEIDVRTETGLPPGSQPKPSLSATIAQALLELQGAVLVTAIDDDGNWHAVTQLDGRLQSDFFDNPGSAEPPAPAALLQ